MGFDARSTLDIARLLNHESTPFAGQPTIDKVDFITEDQESYTKWRSNFGLSIMHDDWMAGYSLRYIGTADDVNGGDFDLLGKSVDALSDSDISASYRLTEGLWCPWVSIIYLIKKPLT